MIAGGVMAGFAVIGSLFVLTWIASQTKPTANAAPVSAAPASASVGSTPQTAADPANADDRPFNLTQVFGTAPAAATEPRMDLPDLSQQLAAVNATPEASPEIRQATRQIDASDAPALHNLP